MGGKTKSATADITNPVNRKKLYATVQPELPLTRKGRRLAKPAPPFEFVLHFAVVSHLHARKAAGWLFTHPASGEVRDPHTAAKLKSMGVNRGWPDLVLIAPDGLFHGLELKREGGRMRPDQTIFAEHARHHGWPYEVTDDLDEALRILEAWGALKPSLYVQGPF